MRGEGGGLRRGEKKHLMEARGRKQTMFSPIGDGRERVGKKKGKRFQGRASRVSGGYGRRAWP